MPKTVEVCSEILPYKNAKLLNDLNIGPLKISKHRENLKTSWNYGLLPILPPKMKNFSMPTKNS